jgi:hypothetical protein
VDDVLWPALRHGDDPLIDWVAGEFRAYRPWSQGVPAVFAGAVGVEVKRQELPIIGDANSQPAATPDAAQVREWAEERRGRKRKWDWAGALCSVIAEANADPDGLPEGYGAQARVGDLMKEWFYANQDGEPQESEISLRARRIVEMIEAHRK